MELISLDNWLLWRQSHSYFIILNLHQEEDEVIWKRSKNEPEKNPGDEEEETKHLDRFSLTCTAMDILSGCPNSGNSGHP